MPFASAKGHESPKLGKSHHIPVSQDGPFPSRALPSEAPAGFTAPRSRSERGALAQLGERLICIQEVRSSILLGSTNSNSIVKHSPLFLTVQLDELTSYREKSTTLFLLAVASQNVGRHLARREWDAKPSIGLPFEKNNCCPSQVH